MKIKATMCGASIIILLLLSGDPATSQISISEGGSYTQDFSIGTSATASVPTNWKVDKQASVRTVGTWASAVSATEYRAGNNMSTTAANGIYNYAAGDPTTSTERAVGWISSGTGTDSGNLYAWLQNSGATTITSMVLAYDVEKYRNGSNAQGFRIQLYYSTDGSNWTSAGSNFLTSFASDADNSGFNPAPGSIVSVLQTLSVSISPGSSLYLAWNYSVSNSSIVSNAQGLGIDNFVINNILPVELTSFVASLKSNQVTLNWKTATEVNNYGFEVEKSYDQKSWRVIGFVRGQGTVNTEQNFRFVDQLSPTDQRVSVISYRLKQIDRGGSVEYSRIVSVTQKPSFKNVALHQNFPNPFNPSTNISFSLPSEQSVSILIYDLLGNEIMRLLNKAPMSAGSHSVSFDAQGVTSGTYLYKIQTEHISLTKRMTLMK